MLFVILQTWVIYRYFYSSFLICENVLLFSKNLVDRLHAVFSLLADRQGSGDVAISLASVRLSVRRQKLVRSMTLIPLRYFDNIW